MPRKSVDAVTGIREQRRGDVDSASSLGIEIIAEGVETLAQRERLLELGCTCAQGFLYGRPEPLA